MRDCFLALSCMLVVACGSDRRPVSPRAASLVGESDEALFAVDWPTSMRADLEANARRGLVVVAFRPPEPLRVLAGCTAEGAYRVEDLSPKEDVVRFATKEELAARLPFSGAGLAGRAGLDAADERVVDLAIVTRARAAAPLLPVSRTDLRGDCEGATHVVTSFLRGAFVMAARSKRDAAVAADVLGIGARANTTTSTLIAKSDGDPNACRATSPRTCDALLKVGLRALAGVSPLTDPSGAASFMRAPWPSEEECLRACEQGDMHSCTGTAVYAINAGDHRSAERYARIACDANNAHGCTILGIVYDPIKPGSSALHDAEKATKLYARGCELGSLDGCVLLSYYAQKKKPFRPEEEPLVRLAARACAAGNAGTCSVAAGWFYEKAVYLETGGVRGRVQALDEAIGFEAKYCELASPKELAKEPCILENWTRLRRALPPE